MDDNFRSKRPVFRKRNSLDGFVSGSGSADSSPVFKRNPNRDPVFDRPEGFHRPNSQVSANTINRVIKKEESTTQLEGIEPKERRRSFLQRRKKDRKPRSKLAKTFRAAGIFSVIVVLAVGGILGYGYLKARNIFRGNGEGAAGLQENVDPVKLRGEGDGRVNILILGKGGPTQNDGPDLTDTVLLASIDPVGKGAAMLSVPRDMWVKDENGQTKINAVYKFAKDRHLASHRGDNQGAEDAGTKAIMEKVSEVLGIPMHYYVMVDFTAFQKAIDTVGGITIDVKESVSEQMLLNGKPYYLNVPVGVQNFDGVRALGYARCRHCDNRSDFGRTDRQREILVALKDKILSAETFANPYKLYQLISTFGDNVRTDIGGLGEVTRLYDIGKEINNSNIKSYGLADVGNPLVTTANISGQSVVVPRAGTFDYSEIQAFVRTNIKDPYLASENARIVVLNGTDVTGAASRKSDELKAYGYNIVRTGDAPTKDYTNTRLIDLTRGEKKYTKSYLEKRLELTASDQVPEGVDVTDADLIIILGAD